VTKQIKLLIAVSSCLSRCPLLPLPNARAKVPLLTRIQTRVHPEVGRKPNDNIGLVLLTMPRALARYNTSKGYL